MRVLAKGIFGSDASFLVGTLVDLVSYLQASQPFSRTMASTMRFITPAL